MFHEFFQLNFTSNSIICVHLIYWKNSMVSMEKLKSPLLFFPQLFRIFRWSQWHASSRMETSIHLHMSAFVFTYNTRTSKNYIYVPAEEKKSGLRPMKRGGRFISVGARSRRRRMKDHGTQRRKRRTDDSGESRPTPAMHFRPAI